MRPPLTCLLALTALTLAAAEPALSIPACTAYGQPDVIALKISESLVEMVEALLGDELSGTFSASVGYLLSQRAFRRFRRRVDYSEYGGAPLLGVGGVVIVGHGRSSAKAIRNAILLADRFSRERLVERLEKGLAGITVTES